MKIYFAIVFAFFISASAFANCEAVVAALFHHGETPTAASGQDRFLAAVHLKQGLGQIELVDGKPDMPMEDVVGLTGVMRGDTQGAAEAQIAAQKLRLRAAAIRDTDPVEAQKLLAAADHITKNVSPGAIGNDGHMRDHRAFYEQHVKPLARIFGFDPRFYELAMESHDIGKGYLDDMVRAYVRYKDSVRAGERPKGYPEFVHDYVLSHEEHSIARIPEKVAEYLIGKGVDIHSPAGREQWVKYSLQTIELIRQHNGVDVSGDLKAKYPALTPAELHAVETAWWAINYKHYAETMGIPEVKYGGDTHLIGDILNYADRSTLTTSPESPYKLARQYGATMDAGPAWIHASFVAPAEGNAALIKAQSYKLEKRANPDQRREIQKITQELLVKNQKLVDLGRDLTRVQDEGAAKFRRFAKPGAKYLYYKDPTGNWSRVDASNKSSVVVELFDGKGFYRDLSTAPGTDMTGALMKLVGRDGRW